jgi:Fic family protein
MRRKGGIFSAWKAENKSMPYIHELHHWPKLTWDHEKIMPLLGSVRNKQGRLMGSMGALGFSLRSEALLQTLTLDVIKSSEIEGEVLDTNQVRSSIARRLGLEIAGLVPSDRHVDGVVEMMLDATQNYSKPLTKGRLFGWHASLFPGGFSGLHKIITGAWRDDRNGPMQVVSGSAGHEKVHFEAPKAVRLEKEMKTFLHGFNEKMEMDPVLKSAIAHLWFVTIHPFDDGNGRIARAITDMQLARADGSSERFYSMSARIRKERKDYYAVLEKTQKMPKGRSAAGIDITAWAEWFLGCLSRALDSTENTLSSVLAKAHFWEHYPPAAMNDRQRKMINKLFEGFEGKLTSSKWAQLTKCSQDTAHRDILELVEKGILTKDSAGGRSTSYSLKPSQSFTP